MDISQLVSIFCEIDDFCKEFDNYSKNYLLTGPSKGKRRPACSLAISEGYIGKKLFDELLANGLKLITRKRKNMKNIPVLECVLICFSEAKKEKVEESK